MTAGTDSAAHGWHFLCCIPGPIQEVPEVATIAHQGFQTGAECGDHGVRSQCPNSRFKVPKSSCPEPVRL